MAGIFLATVRILYWDKQWEFEILHLKVYSTICYLIAGLIRHFYLRFKSCNGGRKYYKAKAKGTWQHGLWIDMRKDTTGFFFKLLGFTTFVVIAFVYAFIFLKSRW